MRDVFNILRQIEANSSRNTKKEILRQNANNENLKKFLLYTYNDRWIFGIGQKSIKKYETLKANAALQDKGPQVVQRSLFGTPKSNTYSGYTDIFDLLEELKLHPYGSQVDGKAVNDFLANGDEEAYYWYTKCILKDLKIGCTATTINEIYEGLIPVFDVMLAHPYADHADKITGREDFQLQQKLNGYRLIVYLHPDGSTQFFTRNGVELFNFQELEADFKKMPRFDYTMVHDGEAQVALSFNETQKYMMRNGPKTGVTYNLFDRLPLEQFEFGESVEYLFERYDRIFVPKEVTHVIKVEELYRGKDLTQLTIWFNYAKSQGWEGIMLKLNRPYVRKRTWWMLKLKEMKEIDLVCTGVNPGKPGTKNEFTLGSITVDFNGVGVDVSGFNNSDRDHYWNNPDEIIGKTITVQYFEETINESGKPSLQFPQFIGVRTDK